jgi:hypothetical protein
MMADMVNSNEVTAVRWAKLSHATPMAYGSNPGEFLNFNVSSGKMSINTRKIKVENFQT